MLELQLLTYSLILIGCWEIVAEEVIGDLADPARALFSPGNPLVFPLVSNPARIHGSPRILEEIRTDVENVLRGREVRNLETYKACKAQHASESGISSLASCLGSLFGSGTSSQAQGLQVNPGLQGQGYGVIPGQQQQWGLSQQQSPQQGVFATNGYYGQGQGQQDLYSDQYGQGQYFGGQQQLGQQDLSGYYNQGPSQGQGSLNQFPIQGQGGQGQYPSGNAWNQGYPDAGMRDGYAQGQNGDRYQIPYYGRPGGQQQGQVLGAGMGYEKRSAVTRSAPEQERPSRAFYRQSKEPFII